MTNEFTSHGMKFRVEGHDFSGHEADFDAVCTAIEGRLDTLPVADVAVHHNAVTWDVEADAYNDPDDTRLLKMVATTCHATLTAIGWQKPDVPFVSISAA